ncbi:MAG: IS66 family transposase [Candidatus Omnitrophica bacterium]|nr:IS66 family transposase [Candidatus Omnitrophota bacterium]MDE2232487.1 IS66 family transposase [Candidatus Omnitrophota bacterium]
MLGKNSGNSSKPPSSDSPFQNNQPSKPKSDRKPGGQPGHQGCTRKPFPKERVTDRQIHLPLKCGECGHSLPKKPGKKDPEPQVQQVVEIPPLKPEIVEHQVEGRYCPSCGKVTWGMLPEEVRGSFGTRLTGFISFLSGRCQMSKRVVQEVLEGLLGVRIALGSLSAKEREVGEALEEAWGKAKTAVQQAAVKNADETGWYLSGDLKWLWIGTTPQVAVFQVQEHRNQEAMKELLGEVPQGMVGSDRFGAYTPIPLEQRQLCWAHFKRDLQGLVDGGEPKGVRIGKGCLGVLQKVFEEWGRYEAGKIGRRGLGRRMETLKARLKRWLKRGREGPPDETGRFCARVMKLYEGYWSFVRVQGVEPTNNLAERDLRTAVLWRKRSYGNRSSEGCRFTERVLTAVQTLRKQKRNVLDYLTEAVAAHRAGRTAPSLLPSA